MESDAFSFKSDALSFKSDLAIIVRCCIISKTNIIQKDAKMDAKYMRLYMIAHSALLYV